MTLRLAIVSSHPIQYNAPAFRALAAIPTLAVKVFYEWEGPTTLDTEFGRDRVGYSASGWNNPGYTTSKLYPYILAEKPLLSILHEKSSANQVMRDMRAGVPVTLNENDTADALSRHVFDERVVAVFERITVKARSKAQ